LLTLLRLPRRSSSSGSSSSLSSSIEIKLTPLTGGSWRGSPRKILVLPPHGLCWPCLSKILCRTVFAVASRSADSALTSSIMKCVDYIMKCVHIPDFAVFLKVSWWDSDLVASNNVCRQSSFPNHKLRFHSLEGEKKNLWSHSGRKLMIINFGLSTFNLTVCRQREWESVRRQLGL
jgi:hypothetical protein